MPRAVGLRDSAGSAHDLDVLLVSRCLIGGVGVSYSGQALLEFSRELLKELAGSLPRKRPGRALFGLKKGGRSATVEWDAGGQGRGEDRGPGGYSAGQRG